ncbi:MAG: M60 family metallopeptidase [Puniceicoccales bacterium]|jgi:hypothetical protein|nr:M60 family metallopeptidase [Puniceicoccales bacterium]
MSKKPSRPPTQTPRRPAAPRPQRRFASPVVFIRRSNSGGGVALFVGLFAFLILGGGAFLFFDQKSTRPEKTALLVKDEPTAKHVENNTEPPIGGNDDESLPEIASNEEKDDVVTPEFSIEVSSGTPVVSSDVESTPSAVTSDLPAVPEYKPHPKAKIVKPVKNTEPSELDREVWKKLYASPSQVLNIPADAEGSTGGERAQLSALVDRYYKIPPRKVVANPAATAFPGPVADSAPRVAKDVMLSASVAGWQSTGLYAPPGELISVRVSSSSVKKGFSIRIGCHSDDLFHPECVGWPRFPRISPTFPINKGTTVVAAPFGGLIYIEMPTQPKSRSQIRVNISGAVEAPHFVLGKTDAKEWARLRDAPAPWGELSCRTITLSVPTQVLRNLANPEKVMKLWERIIDDQDWLAGWNKRINNPERLVPDAKISIGYMHSGYPVMCHMDMCENMCSYETLTRDGNWGFFHEFGHNHQSDEWTFAGYGETTCNIFAMYNMEKIAGKPIGSPGNERDDFLKAVLADPLTATGPDHFLSIYIPVIKAFGWAPLQKTFTEYTKSKGADYNLRSMRNRNARADSHSKRNRPNKIRETNDAKRKDNLFKETFVRIWAKHCKADLSAYFEKVGYPVSTSMKQNFSSRYGGKPWLPPEAGGPEPVAKGTPKTDKKR